MLTREAIRAARQAHARLVASAGYDTFGQFAEDQQKLREHLSALCNTADAYWALVERVEALAQVFERDAEGERRFNLRVSCGPQAVADKLRALLVSEEPTHE